MRLGVTVLLALLAAAAAAPDIDDIPPVDELREQLTSGQLTPSQLIDMSPSLPDNYINDVKNGLPDHLRQEIVDLVHQLQDSEAAVEEDTDHHDEDEAQTEEDPAEQKVEADAEEPMPDLAPVEQPIEGDSPAVLRASPGLRAEPGEDGGTGSGGSGSSGSSGVSEGGVLPMPGVGVGKAIDDASAARLLLEYSTKEQTACSERYSTAYDYYSKDVTRGPDKINSEVAYMKLWREFAENSTLYDLSGLDRTDLVAAFMLLKNSGPSALADEPLRELVTAITNMESKFSSARVTDFHDNLKADLKLYQDIRVKMATSTDRDELAHYWLTWRGLVGRSTGKMYADYVRLLDTAAKEKNADWDAWDLMTYPYRHGNEPNILDKLEEAWKDIKPVYEQLHSYARLRLRQRYGTDAVPVGGHIPAHLLGSHEADDWSALEELMMPYDNASRLDFHGQCNRQSTPVDVGLLKKTAWELYTNLGLNATSISDTLSSRLNMASTDAENVLFLPRVLDRCSSGGNSAVGFYPTNTTLSDYIELIELFGTMQRYNERTGSLLADSVGFPYKDRLGYNAYGMDLAIGGARALAAITPKGLSKLRIQIDANSDLSVINVQMVQALKLLPRLAASMAAVRWQFGVMTGAIKESQFNDKWWQYKREYQGVSPPEERPGDLLDAFADGTLTLPNYHLRRLIGGIAMFSVHKFHCKIYDSSAPLSECAIFDNKELGEDITAVLVSGNSKPLKDQLSALTQERDLSAAALLQRMEPLTDWLEQYNKEHGDEENAALGESTEMIAIIVGVVIAVIVIGLAVFFLVARKKQKYEAAPTREGKGPARA